MNLCAYTLDPNNIKIMNYCGKLLIPFYNLIELEESLDDNESYSDYYLKKDAILKFINSAPTKNSEVALTLLKLLSAKHLNVEAHYYNIFQLLTNSTYSNTFADYVVFLEHFNEGSELFHRHLKQYQEFNTELILESIILFSSFLSSLDEEDVENILKYKEQYTDTVQQKLIVSPYKLNAIIAGYYKLTVELKQFNDIDEQAYLSDIPLDFVMALTFLFKEAYFNQTTSEYASYYKYNLEKYINRTKEKYDLTPLASLNI